MTWSTSDVAVCCSNDSVSSGCDGEVGSALAQLVQQSRVLDGDDSLGGKISHKFNLLSVKRRTSWR